MTAAAPEILRSPRSGDAYNAHSYHTKVPPHAIARLISRHLPGGGVVADSYCGSGSTGVAAAIAERLLADEARYDVLLGDLSPYATFIAKGLNGAPENATFDRGASDCLALARKELGELWSTSHVDGRRGEIVYTVWSELLTCPNCATESRFWDQAVDLDRGEIRRLLACACGHEFRKDEAERVTERVFDSFVEEWIERTVREPVLIAYQIDGERHEKTPDADDLISIDTWARIGAPSSCPKQRMLHKIGPWGDLYRSGYHRGITHIHHFYTWRNFVTLGYLWNAASTTEAPDAVRLLISSYNLAHATLMSRLVFKSGNTRPVLTGYQTGTLYISSLPVEKNPLIGIARKQRALKRAFDVVRGRRGKVNVISAAAQNWGKLAPKIDYAFVDPPFGGNIPYAEANFIPEAWLGEFTDQVREASISKAQEKSAGDYCALLAEGFDALRARMNRHAKMTVMFHSAASEPWKALTGALSQAGFQTEGVLLLDKRQGSFKQVKTKDAVQGDLLIEVKPRDAAKRRPARVGPDLAVWLGRTLDPDLLPLDSETERGLFSRYLAEQVAHGTPVTTSASKFYAAARALAASYLDPSAVL
jgi:hypothetical protein